MRTYAMPYKTVQEGAITLRVPVARIPEEGEIFYNPEMRFDRNVSVAAAAVMSTFIETPKNEIRACDLLSATGVRALRYAKESGLHVTANDISQKAASAISKHAKQNKVTLNVTNLEGSALLAKEHFDFIDIDPFGSPITFVDNAVTSFSFRGFLAATATDLGPLVGSYPEVCRRRYGLRSLFTDYNRELGLRILVTSVMNKFFQHEKAFVPLFSYARRHYFRIYGRVRYGNKNVNRVLREFGYVSHCFECGWRACALTQACPLCKAKTEFCGEIYMGEMQNLDFCKAVAEDLWNRNFGAEAMFVKEVAHEAPFPLYYDTHYIAEKLGNSVPPIEKIIGALLERGYHASRTHFSGTAVKTNARFQDVVAAIKTAQP